MPELTDAEKTAKLQELKNDPRFGDLHLLVNDLLENDIIPAWRERAKKAGSEETNIFDHIFGTKKGE